MLHDNVIKAPRQSCRDWLYILHSKADHVFTASLVLFLNYVFYHLYFVVILHIDYRIIVILFASAENLTVHLDT